MLTMQPTGVSRNAAPFLHGTEAGAVLQVLRTGHYGHGEESEQFERELARFLGVPDVVSVASGTAALHIALLAAGIGPGDEVIVPSFTFCATIHAILACGATPRFTDIDPATLCVTGEDVMAAITPATRAVIPVLYGGRAVDLTRIAAQLASRGIVITEDAAHAFGSRCDHQRVGSTGQITCFSFDPIKNLTCGEGGAIVPRDPHHAERARRIRDLGIIQPRSQRTQSTSYTVDRPGLRAHLPAINAAIGRAQLAGFPAVEARRKHLWRAYHQALDGASGITLVDVDPVHSVPFNCVVRIASGRDQVFAKLRACGIGAGVHYPPNHLQPAFAAWRNPLPRTERTASQVLSLPFHPALDDSDIEHVTAELKAALR
jgi:dTDP-4-amino-4,6-dideoxygalactose transaminase